MQSFVNWFLQSWTSKYSHLKSEAISFTVTPIFPVWSLLWLSIQIFIVKHGQRWYLGECEGICVEWNLQVWCLFQQIESVCLFEKHGLGRNCRGTAGVNTCHTFFMVIVTMFTFLASESRYYDLSTNKEIQLKEHLIVISHLEKLSGIGETGPHQSGRG